MGFPPHAPSVSPLPKRRRYLEQLLAVATLVTLLFVVPALLNFKAVADLGVAAAKADGRATVARMKAMPTQDDAFGAGSIRADGRKLHPAYLYEVKTPAESRYQHDYYER